MTVLTVAAFFAMAAGCAPGVDPRLLLVQAQRESHLDTAAISPKNTDGSTDYGLMQINSGNFGLLGIRSIGEAMDPCRNLMAAADLYRTLSRYNSGSPTKSIASYSAGIMARLSRSPSAPSPVPNDEAPGLEDSPGKPETLEIKQ